MSQRVFDTRVLPMFGLGLVFTALVAYIARDLPNGVSMVAFFVAFGISWTAGSWEKKLSTPVSMGLFFLMTAAIGVMMVPLLGWATAIGGPTIIIQALGITGITFGSLMAFGLTSKRDFSNMGRFLFMAMIGLILTGLVSFFLPFSTTMHAVFSFAGVLIFSAYVLYNMSMIKSHMTDSQYLLAALMLYINFINLFQNILVLLGIFGRND